MGDKLQYGAEKFPIGGVDGALDKERGLPKSSELFSLMFLAPERPFTSSQPLTLL